MKHSVGTIVSIHVADAVKDLAISTVSTATSADYSDVFIDMETVGDNFPQFSDYNPQVIEDLRECVEEAHKQEADYLHLY